MSTWTQGDAVRVTRGKYAGRAGRVSVVSTKSIRVHFGNGFSLQFTPTALAQAEDIEVAHISYLDADGRYHAGVA